MYLFPHMIETRHGEKLVFKGIEIEDGEEKVLIENFIQPGAGPAMHVHFKQDEGLTIVKGKIGYQTLGEEPRYANAGESVTFQRGVPHRFWNAGDDLLNCIGWIKPANSIVFFLTSIYDALNKSDTNRPEMFDGAYLVTRYRSEYDMPELPGFVKKVIMPATVAVGKMLGKYEHFKDAPAPLR